MAKYLINLDGYLRISLAKSLKNFYGKIDMSFFCAKKSDQILLKQDFPNCSIYCWEDYLEKNQNKVFEEEELLKLEKLIGTKLVKANYSFYNYLQFYKSVKIKNEDKLKGDHLRSYLNYNFYSDILKKESPNIILHEHAGGSGSEILERLAKDEGIKYYVFATRFFDNRFLLMDVVNNNFDTLDKFYLKCNPGRKELKAVKNIFLKIQNNTSPAETIHLKNISIKKKNRYINFLFKIKNFYSKTKLFNYISSNFPPFSDFIFERIKSKIRMLYVENFICEKQNEIFKKNRNKKFITFFLQSEPELIIYKLGGRHFSDQKQIIKNLALSLPANFLLLIKEHKSQGINSRYRNLEFFRDIKRFSNVRVIKSHESPIDLIDKSYAVANLSGTIGLEALVRNKPLILFGSVFYQNFENVFQIKKFEDLDDIIDRIKQKYDNFKDEYRCLKFAYAIRKTMFKGNIFDGSYLTKNNEFFLTKSLERLFSLYR